MFLFGNDINIPMYCLLTYPLAKRVYGIQLWGTGEICKTVKVIRDNINKTNEMSLKTKSSANSAQLRSLWSEMPDMRLAMTAYFKSCVPQISTLNAKSAAVMINKHYESSGKLYLF